MSRLNRILIAATGLTLVGASLAEARQVRVRETAPVLMVRQESSGWLGFSYRVSTVRGPGREIRQPIVIMEVVKGSPAERAGLLAGDTLLAINEIRISEELMTSLVKTLQPGDDVQVRLRRSGRDRTIAIEAAERPEQYAIVPESDRFMFEIDPDSIRGRMMVYLDSMRVTLDSLRIPRMRVERSPEGIWMYTDTGRVRMMPPDSVWQRDFRGAYVLGDSLRTLFEYRFPRDSMRLQFDSVFARVLPDMRELNWQTDSLRVKLDSLRWIMPDRPNVWLEAPGRGITTIGSRAIAGAELTELNPGLGEYFGTDEGVLVVRVPDGTPAARAGLRAGDVIVEVNGLTISDVSNLQRQISHVRSGDPIRLEVLRKKQRRTIELKED